MNIKLSKKHGVNPSLLVCPICGKELGIALLGYLKGDKEAPKTIKGQELCEDCKKLYITIIEIESETNREPTGRKAFVPKEAINVECPKGIALADVETFNKIKNNEL